MPLAKESCVLSAFSSRSGQDKLLIASRFAVATRAPGAAWQALTPPVRVPASGGAALSPDGIGALWRGVWQRIWHTPGA